MPPYPAKLQGDVSISQELRTIDQSSSLGSEITFSGATLDLTILDYKKLSHQYILSGNIQKLHKL